MATDEGNATVTKPYREPVTDQDFRDAILGYTGEAQGILDAVEDAQRDLSDAQRKHIDDALLKAEGLKVRWDQKRKRAGRAAEARSGSFSTPYSDVAQLFGGSGSGTSYTPQGRAARGKAWGRAVTHACSDDSRRYKGITPAGSVLVGIPSPDAYIQGRPVMQLRSLIPTRPTEGVFAYLRQDLRTNRAEVVPAGQKKPTSDYLFSRVQDTVSTIAHLSSPLHRSDLSDSDSVQDLVSGELLYGLEAALEAEVIEGDGTGDRFLGLQNTPGIQTANRTAADGYYLIRVLRTAITRLENVGIDPAVGAAFVMAPSDWEEVETTVIEDGSLALNGGGGASIPVNRAARTIWGIPVIPSVGCIPGTAFLADFAGSTRLWSREEAQISWSESVTVKDLYGTGLDGNLFESNQVIFRAEGRWGFGVTRPTGVVKINLVSP